MLKVIEETGTLPTQAKWWYALDREDIDKSQQITLGHITACNTLFSSVQAAPSVENMQKSDTTASEQKTP